MRKKIKKFVFDELADNFEVVSEQEQAMYIGGNRIYLRADGSYLRTVETSDLHETLVLDGHEFSQQRGTWENRGNGLVGKGSAQNMFIFLAQYSTSEWGMAIQDNGRAIVFSDFSPDSINMQGNANTVMLVHSHPTCGLLSPCDYDAADAHRHKYHVLFYNGQFRKFDSAGFFGDWFDSFLW